MSCATYGILLHVLAGCCAKGPCISSYSSKRVCRPYSGPPALFRDNSTYVPSVSCYFNGLIQQQGNRLILASTEREPKQHT